MVNSVLEQDATSAPAANTTGLMVISYLQLRFYVGVIGVLLPWVLIVGNWAIGDGLQPSLSGYYYTPMRNIFACVAFVLLAMMALRFAKRELACVALIYPGSRVYSYSLLILETILMTAFGLSWFVKGGKLFAAGDGS
jgi:hypothetical protein